MQTDNDQTKSKAPSVIVRKKSDGWRERQESSAAGVTPRAFAPTKTDGAESTLVRS